VEQKPEELINQLFRFYSASSTKIPCCVMNVEGDGKGTEEVRDGCTHRDAYISPRFRGTIPGRAVRTEQDRALHIIAHALLRIADGK